MASDRINYRKAELSNVDTSEDFSIRLKIVGVDGGTKWLDITPTEFEQIKVVLLDWRQ